MRQFVRAGYRLTELAREETPISIRYFLPRRRRQCCPYVGDKSQNQLQLEQQHSEQIPQLPVNVLCEVVPKEIVEILKVEAALELGVSDYQERFKGDYPATVHAQVSKYLRIKLKALSQKIIEDPTIIDRINSYINTNKGGRD